MVDIDYIFADPIHAFVQPSRQMSVAEMVRFSTREKQEENHP